VRAVFLYEDDEQQLRHNYLAREGRSSRDGRGPVGGTASGCVKKRSGWECWPSPPAPGTPYWRALSPPLNRAPPRPQRLWRRPIISSPLPLSGEHAGPSARHAGPSARG